MTPDPAMLPSQKNSALGWAFIRRQRGDLSGSCRFDQKEVFK
jgi:hypothetical protein